MAEPDDPGPAQAPGTPPASGRRPIGAVLVPIAATLITLLTLPFMAMVALLSTEPPECFMTFTDVAQAQCDAALSDGHDLTPAILLGVAAAVEFAAFVALWVLRRRTVPRWTLFGVVVAAALFFFLFPPPG
ncbi:hypothetical protein [Nocardiopsis potens]|uniref:hypothetical protein n=1 Tax=Nocardiopsis potens TaxID=1246458 RepID=UPI000349751D|nr:hypothetical protein [Nocardiopsis potens]